MRVCLTLALGVCLLQPGLSQAQATAKPQTPPPATSKPQAPAQERKEIKVTEKVLKTYVGDYEMTPDRILTVTLENGYLWGQPTGQAKRQLFAESETKFFLKDIDAQVTFQKEKGKVVGMIMDQEGAAAAGTEKDQVGGFCSSRDSARPNHRRPRGDGLTPAGDRRGGASALARQNS